MFYRKGILFCSDTLTEPSVCHGFSTREGGISVHPYTCSMNLADGREDDHDTVCRNTDIFARAVTEGKAGMEAVVTTAQIHSTKIRILTAQNRGEGTLHSTGEACDGFVTDVPGVMPVIRVADCTPILLVGRTALGKPVVGAVHAGWRGSAGGIAGEAVEHMLALGTEISTIRAAVGPHIGTCCYEVGQDMVDQVSAVGGEAFSARFCTFRRMDVEEKKYTADLTGMNCFHLLARGVLSENIDVSPACTMCEPTLFHSHRATAGKRGAMGAGICILP